MSASEKQTLISLVEHQLKYREKYKNNDILNKPLIIIKNDNSMSLDNFIKSILKCDSDNSFYECCDEARELYKNITQDKNLKESLKVLYSEYEKSFDFFYDDEEDSEKESLYQFIEKYIFDFFMEFIHDNAEEIYYHTIISKELEDLIPLYIGDDETEYLLYEENERDRRKNCDMARWL